VLYYYSKHIGVIKQYMIDVLFAPTDTNICVRTYRIFVLNLCFIDIFIFILFRCIFCPFVKIFLFYYP